MRAWRVCCPQGFNGPWTRNPDRFDNDYFRDIAFVPWVRRNLPSGLTEWRRAGPPRPEIMLNIDMELVYRAVNDNGRCGPVRGNNAVGCQTFANRPDGPFEHAIEFATDEPAWHTAFAAAMEKMIELGYAPGEGTRSLGP